MRPAEPRPLEEFFREGVEARERGLTLRDNPYAAGSAERHEWDAGFCATVASEDDEGDLDPNEGEKRGLHD